MVILNKVNNLPNFDYRGKNSLEDHKVYMTSKPSIPMPELRAEHIVVKGRDSTYTLTDGTYDDIEISFGLRTYRGTISYQGTLNRLNDWLRTDFSDDFNEIVFSEYPQWYFNVKVVMPYTWEYVSFTGEMTTTIKLRVEPFKYSTLQHDIVGNSSTPTPITPKTFKAQNNGAWRIKPESQLQNITDLSRQGYQRLLGNIVDDQNDLNKITDVDGSSMILGQTKYTSGNYHNVVPDFYSPLGVWANTKASTIEVSNATRATLNFTGAGTVTVQMKNVLAGKMYLADIGFLSGNLSKMRIQVLAPNGANVGSSVGMDTCSFFSSTAGTYTLVINSDIAQKVVIDKPFATQENKNASSYNPEGKSSYAGLVVSVDVTKLVKDIEPNIYGASTSEVDIKNILKSRGVEFSVERVVSHSSGASQFLYMLNKDTGYDQIGGSLLPAGVTQKVTNNVVGASAIDRLYYQNVQGSLSLWATFLIASADDFIDPNASLDEKYFTVDSFNVTVKMNTVPSAEKVITIDGTTTAIPYLKLYKVAGATEASLQFASYDMYGKVWVSNVTVKNLANVGANQHIEIDSKYLDVIRYQEDNPKMSTPWNINCTIDQFPLFNVGKNWVTVSGISKLEIEWRTRMI
ncbi:tail protein [Bacillus phage BC-7]|nr:tail protein [Bacillus phage BC-7]